MAKYTGSLNQGRSVADMMAREFWIKGQVMAHYHEFTPQEQGRRSTQLALELLRGNVYVRGVDKKEDDGERHVFAIGEKPRHLLTDLRLLAVEALKEPGDTDPALRAALVDEVLANIECADLPVTREWLFSLPCGFSTQERCVMTQRSSRAIPIRLYFQMNVDGSACSWGVVLNNAGEMYNLIDSMPTRRKVFAFCLAVGINLMEKS